MRWARPDGDAQWESRVAAARASADDSADLGDFEQGSSALLAALCRVQTGRSTALKLINVPDGLLGLARVAGVEPWFTWNEQ
ncbi:hypothetical protein GH975_10495 [Litorivicinus lipolyticus]|uniref:STAS domain-containing protein n=1 Tax=Litorivicinus lipolyticus TaxID=418701 RepID=A0A5Q2QCW6_9GAMM|nr:hypothetical protein [Litorivicinus lipolyticus]QGG80974.1 hypothetical protein GH975_10495 [Litorivicinus lipolyticus]